MTRTELTDLLRAAKDQQRKEDVRAIELAASALERDGLKTSAAALRAAATALDVQPLVAGE